MFMEMVLLVGNGEADEGQDDGGTLPAQSGAG